MNYLAHAFLSANDPEILIGNFIADHLRGNHFGNLPPRVIEGIYLHRRIDTFTDAHPAFKDSKRLFYNGFEKYSGILIDIYFDYFLAKDFDKYSSLPLNQFSQNVYGIYKKSEILLPASSLRFLEYVTKNNIYLSYASFAGITQVLNHLSHRIKHRVQLDDSANIFIVEEKKLQENFDLFIKDVMKEFMPSLNTL